MDGTWIMAIMLFASVMTLTPGPNNVMLLASGAQFGYQKTLPHIAGVIIGVSSLFFVILLGFGTVLEQHPEINDMLKVVGSAYLFWLAWKIATASTVIEKSTTNMQRLDGDVQNDHSDEAYADIRQSEFQKISLLDAAIFQLVNPKSWAVSLGSISTFTMTGEHYFESGLWIMACFAVSGFMGMSLWTCFGMQMAKQLTTVKRKRIFNYTMGAMTVCTLYFILN